MVLGLEDLEVVIVGTAQSYRTARETALPQVAVFRVFRVLARPGCGSPRLRPRDRLRDLLRDLAFGRVGDKRGASVREATVPPELVVGKTHVTLHAQPRAALGRGERGRPHVCFGDLFGRQEFTPFVFVRSFQGGRCAVVPDALQIGHAPGHVWRWRAIRYLAGGGRLGDRHRRQCQGREDSQYKFLAIHRVPLVVVLRGHAFGEPHLFTAATHFTPALPRKLTRSTTRQVQSAAAGRLKILEERDRAPSETWNCGSLGGC